MPPPRPTGHALGAPPPRPLARLVVVAISGSRARDVLGAAAPGAVSSNSAPCISISGATRQAGNLRRASRRGCCHSFIIITIGHSAVLCCSAGMSQSFIHLYRYIHKSITPLLPSRRLGAVYASRRAEQRQSSESACALRANASAHVRRNGRSCAEIGARAELCAVRPGPTRAAHVRANWARGRARTSARSALCRSTRSRPGT